MDGLTKTHPQMATLRGKGRKMALGSESLGVSMKTTTLDDCFQRSVQMIQAKVLMTQGCTSMVQWLGFHGKALLMVYLMVRWILFGNLIPLAFGLVYQVEY